MRKKIIWLIFSCLIALSLVLASCAPAPTAPTAPTTPTTPTTTPTTPTAPTTPAAPEKEMVKDMLGRMVEKPRQGGHLNYAEYQPLTPWDAAYSNERGMRTHSLVMDDLLEGAWTKSLYGSGEHSWQQAGPMTPEDARYGKVAESWEKPDATTNIYHIRKGMRFHNKPPTNGRAVTADDVVASFNYYFDEPKSYLNGALDSPPTSITALDKYTVEIKWTDASAALQGDHRLSMSAKVFPADALAEFGEFTDWRNVIGTGPYMVEDVVAGAAASLVRHPGYWERDPMHPDLDLQLPYADKVTWNSISDKSTQMAALRTGKVDVQRDVVWEDALQMKESRPDMQYTEYVYHATPLIFLRQDIERPWNDKRVRHALYLAMDNPSIVEDFYGGYGVLLSAPILPSVPSWYIELEEFPEETQALYGYDLGKAKQLMKEAGYEAGFDVEIMHRAREADVLAIIKANWADINVNLKLNLVENSAHSARGRSLGYDEGILWWAYSRNVNEAIQRYSPTIKGVNLARVDDPVINANAAKIAAAQVAGDDAEITRLIKEIQPHMLDMAWEIQQPNFFYFYLAQPWVQRVSAAYSLGDSNYLADLRYLWIDTDMKKEMGY